MKKKEEVCKFDFGDLVKHKSGKRAMVVVDVWKDDSVDSLGNQYVCKFEVADGYREGDFYEYELERIKGK